MADRLCTGLQIRVGRFDSGLRLQEFKKTPRFNDLGVFFMYFSAKKETQPTLLTHPATLYFLLLT